MPTSTLFEAINNPESIALRFDGASYTLKIEYSELVIGPSEGPLGPIRGVFQDRDIEFIGFIDGSTLILECYAKDTHGVPEHIRDGVVHVSAI